MSNKMSRRSFLSGMAALGGSALLGACAPKEAAPSAGEEEQPKAEEAQAVEKEPVTITYAGWWGAFNSTALPPALEDLKEVLPHVTVELQEIADRVQFFPTCFAAGTCPDICYHDNFFSQYYDSGLILELSSYYDADGIDFYNDFYHGLALCLWKGKIYAVPHMFETCVLFYNRDLVEEYWGQDLWEAFPDGNWDLEDMVEVAKACTQDTDGDGKVDQWGLFVNHRHYYYGMETQSWTRGGSIFDIDNVKYDWTSDISSACAHFMLDSVRGPEAFIITMEDYSEVNSAANVTFPMMAGKVAMRIRMSTDTGRLIGTVGPGDDSGTFRWDLFHLPNYKGNQAVTRAGGHPNTIAKTTEHPGDAWAVCRELGTSLGQKYIAQTKMSVPCYRKDPELRKMLEVGVPEHDNVLMDVVEKKGGYGDHMRFNNETEVLRMYQKEMDLLFTEPYEDAKARLDETNVKLEKDMNEAIDYGGGEKPYAGLPFPFKPGQVI
jgi:ABC-type glycerol-3-phosphate transport system substrate-binding protein